MARTDNIVRIKNFLTSNQLKEFQDFFNDESTFTDENIKSRSMVTVNPSYDVFDSCKIYLDKVCEAVTDFFGLAVVDFAGTCFRKWYPGEFQPPHSDCEANIYFENEDLKCDPFYNFASLFLEYGAVCYINDEYEGGELFFPNHSTVVKPSVNELIFFPATSYYIHGVNEVVSGNRLVIQNFLTTTKLLYIWKKFVQGKENLKFIKYTQKEKMRVRRDFDRSNMPYDTPYRWRD